jgi:hypothetical protein
MTTFLNVTDRATTTLATTITSGGLSIVVNTGDGALFPSTNFIITIENERILIDSRSTDTLTVNASGRGYGGTSAASHTAGVAVQLRVTATSITEMQSAINARQLTANLDTTTTLGTSDTLYPSQKAVKTYVDTGIVGISLNQVATASANAKVSSSTERSTGSNTYAKIKETTVFFGGTIRVVFDLKGNVSWTGNGRIYVNGVAVGTERAESTGNYTTQATEDISVNPFDKIQIYARISSTTVYVKNFIISYDLSAGNNYYINPSY